MPTSDQLDGPRGRQVIAGLDRLKEKAMKKLILTALLILSITISAEAAD